MTKTMVLILALTALAFGFVPGPESYESKWLLPGLGESTVLADSIHDYDVRFYQVDLNLPMTTGAMDARAGIWVRSEVPALDSVVFDFSRLVCDSVKVGGAGATFTTGSAFLTVHLPAPVVLDESTYVEVFYHRVSTMQNRGFYFYLRGSGSNRNHTTCYSMAEPEDARSWFPCWDKPWDKAEQGSRVSVTLPDSFTVCANGVLDSVKTNPGGTKTFWWTHRYPIPTYLINFAASIFATWNEWYVYAPGESMPIRFFVWPEDSAASVNSFANTADMVAFYSQPDRFGQYPFLTEKYGMVAVYPFGAGGMEHQTMTTVHRSWVTNGSESGIAHELGHMWLGDCVTCFIWAEIWINEGGASYMDPLYMQHQYGHEEFLRNMEDYRQGYFEADAQGRHPIYNPGMYELFDWGHTYCKAGWVNHMTRYVEGDTSFDNPGIWFASERAFIDSFKYGTATTEDRKRIHEQMTGLDLDWFYDEWVYQAGYPDYTVNWFGQETTDGWEIVLDVGQSNGSQAPDCFHIPVEARVSLSAGGDTLLHWAINSNPQRNVFALSAEPTGIAFDPGEWILKRATITSGIANELKPEVGVTRATLHALTPNPCAGQPRLKLSLPHAQNISLSVFNATGRLVRTVYSGRLSAGHHEFSWDRCDTHGREVSRGAYLIRLTGDRGTETRRLILN